MATLMRGKGNEVVTFPMGGPGKAPGREHLIDLKSNHIASSAWHVFPSSLNSVQCHLPAWSLSELILTYLAEGSLPLPSRLNHMGNVKKSCFLAASVSMTSESPRV